MKVLQACTPHRNSAMKVMNKHIFDRVFLQQTSPRCIHGAVEDLWHVIPDHICSQFTRNQSVHLLSKPAQTVSIYKTTG